MKLLLVFFAVILAPNSAMIAADNLDESQAIREIERLGGKVERDETLPGRPVMAVGFGANSRFQDMDVPLLKPFTKLTRLDLSHTEICGTHIRGAGLTELRGLKNLTTLYLNDTQISDAGLKELKEILKNLTTLGLSGTKITGAGMKEPEDSRSSRGSTSTKPRPPTLA